MRLRNGLYGLGLIAAALLTIAWGNVHMQRPDAGALMFPAVTIQPQAAKAATALTGAAVDLAQYGGAVAVMTVGYAVDSVNNRRYAVLEDSTAGVASWNLVDSIQLDTIGGGSYKDVYHGSNRWIKEVIRASNVGDTMYVSATILRAFARFRN